MSSIETHPDTAAVVVAIAGIILPAILLIARRSDSAIEYTRARKLDVAAIKIYMKIAVIILFFFQNQPEQV